MKIFVLLYGTNGMKSNLNEHEFGLELDKFYIKQKLVAECKMYMDCMYYQDDYLSFFDDECNVCVSKELLQDDNVCYNEFDNKQEYRLFLRKSEYYQQIEEIIQWNAIKIIEIKESDHSVRNDKYGEYGNNNKVEKVYTVIVQIDKEYILFRDYIKGHKNI